jgi:hypothetical protein
MHLENCLNYETTCTEKKCLHQNIILYVQLFQVHIKLMYKNFSFILKKIMRKKIIKIKIVI